MRVSKTDATGLSDVELSMRSPRLAQARSSSPRSHGQPATAQQQPVTLEKTASKMSASLNKSFRKIISRSKVNPLLGFKGLDAFEYSPQYKYSVVRTHIGAALTILGTLLVVAFIGYTLNEFIRGSVAKTTSQLPTDPDMKILIGPTTSLALAIETDRDADAYDPTLLTVSFRETTQSGPVSANCARSSRSLGLATNCSVADRPELDPYYLCPTLWDGNLQGQFKDLTYRYIRVQVALCSGTGCKPLNVTKAAVTVLSAPATLPPTPRPSRPRSKFTIWLYYEDFDAQAKKPELHAFTRRYFAAENLAHSIDLLLAPRRVLVGPRAYFDGTDRTFNLSDVQETSMTIQSATWAPGTPILTFFLRMNDVYIRDSYAPYAFPKLVGDWGALWTAVTLSLGALAFYYNQWTFERAVKKHLGKAVDIRSLVALDLKLADISAIDVDEGGNRQTKAQLREALARLRQVLSAEVHDARGSQFDHGKGLQEVAALVQQAPTPRPGRHGRGSARRSGSPPPPPAAGGPRGPSPPRPPRLESPPRPPRTGSPPRPPRLDGAARRSGSPPPPPAVGGPRGPSPSRPPRPGSPFRPPRPGSSPRPPRAGSPPRPPRLDARLEDWDAVPPPSMALPADVGVGAGPRHRSRYFYEMSLQL